MIVLDTVGVVVVISDERRPLEYARASATAETVSMEALAHCLQHAVRDLLPTSGTHCQGILWKKWQKEQRDQTERASKFHMKFITVMQKSTEIFKFDKSEAFRVCVLTI